MMTRNAIVRIRYPALVVGIVLGLLGVVLGPGSHVPAVRVQAGQAQAAPGSNIDPTDKWAWGTNIGWVNFAPTHGGVTVYADHLEGYAWAENVGWIRLGSHTGGGAHTYGNTSATDYGVNRDISSGELAGYAWSTNAGWVRFDPTHGGVTIDPDSGDFGGYAWGENVGWIHFAHPDAYGVRMVIHHLHLPLVLREYP